MDTPNADLPRNIETLTNTQGLPRRPTTLLLHANRHLQISNTVPTRRETDVEYSNVGGNTTVW